MSTSDDAPIEKLKSLPSKSKRLAALDRLLSIAPALEAAGAPAMTEDEIGSEIKAVRAERHAMQASR